MSVRPMSLAATTDMAAIWRCPHCRGPLSRADGSARCTSCNASFETVAGIPDFRPRGASWIEDDLRLARELAGTPGRSAAELVRSVYARRSNWNSDQVELRTRQVLDGVPRLERELHDWLGDIVRRGEVFLDLGCGPGMLIAAAVAAGARGVGVDASMTWLVVAKQLIAEAGGEPVLAAGLGEQLPLPDAALDAVVSLDVIEHVGDPARFLSEIDRVARPKGRIALSTPNRFSLTPEPHVFVWGVGWLPQPLQAGYVRWRSGKDYSDTRLLSSFGLRRLLKSNTHCDFKLIVPPISEEEIDHFGPFKAWLARGYNRVRTLSWLRWSFLLIAPFFRVTATKAAGR